MRVGCSTVFRIDNRLLQLPQAALDNQRPVIQTAQVSHPKVRIPDPMTRTHRFFTLTFCVLFAHLFLNASDQIPSTAWRIPIGQPPTNPGGRKPELTNIDDG